MSEPKALLVSLRDPHDPMSAHERACFAEAARLPIDHVAMHFMQDGRPSHGSLASVDAVFFGGSGAYSVLDDHPWIDQMLAALIDAVESGFPAYASCFGFQGLARAMGGEVVHDEARKEIGGTPMQLTEAGGRDGLFSPLPGRFWAQQGHKDHVVGLPAGVTLLVRGEGVEAQAFRVDGAPFWASQFHPELRRHHTLERFEHYLGDYLGDGDEDAIIEELRSLPETPELGEVLARLVRGAY